MRIRVGLASVMAAAAVAGGAQAQAASPIPEDAAVIFASDRDHERDQWGLPSNALYVATLDGKVTRITHSKFSHNHFEVSPNRRLIAVNRYSRGDANHDGKYFPLDDWKELWIIDTVAGKERRIAPQIDAGWGGLAWSPDSKWVYFATPSVTKMMDIVRVNVDTEKVEVLTANLNALMGYKGDDKRKWVSDVCLSADGKWLVFIYRGPDVMAQAERGKPQIAVMKTDGSEAHVVTDGGPLPSGAKRGAWTVGDFDPDMAPDDKHIAFARVSDRAMVTKDLSVFDIMVVDRDGKNLKSISPQTETAAEFIPNWGRRGVIFTHLDPKGGIGPIYWDPTSGKRTAIPIGGPGTHVQWIPDAPQR
jgi:Tol biopolymer transport system component